MKKIYSLFLILLLAIGCYEDKGNYNYKDIKELTIREFDSGDNVLNVTVGEDMIVKPEITPDITTDIDRYTFKWTLNGETRPEWNKKDFIWTADRPTIVSKNYESLVLEITDTYFGTKYTNKGDVIISPEFVTSNGFLILSEDESGNSKLHYMKYLKLDKRVDPVDPSSNIYFPVDVKKYINVYEKQNGNELLGKGPIGIQEHYVNDPYGAQYCIFQESGAIDIEYTALKKEGLFSASFESGNYPVGTTHLNGGSIMHWLDVMSDQKGRLFSRYKHDENLYNTGIFIEKPIEYNGEVLEECTVFRTRYVNNNAFQGTFIFDKKNGRLLHMFDGGTDYMIDHKDAGKIIVVPDPEGGVPDGCRSFGDLKGCEILALNIEYGGNNDLCIVYKDETGKIVLQVADLYQPYGETRLVNYAMENHVIANVPANISNICMPPIFNRSYIFIVSGNKIYLTDINSKNYSAELYYTADSDIAVIRNGGSSPWNIIFGTADGFFYSIDVSGAKNKISAEVEDHHKLLYKTEGFGKIVDLILCTKSSH